VGLTQEQWQTVIESLMYACSSIGEIGCGLRSLERDGHYDRELTPHESALRAARRELYALKDGEQQHERRGNKL
jgi:hypothetical protein